MRHPIANQNDGHGDGREKLRAEITCVRNLRTASGWSQQELYEQRKGGGAGMKDSDPVGLYY